jgi:hypothetical protein
MKLDIFDLNKFVELNKIKEVTNHFILDSMGLPDKDGLFSLDIFGRYGSPDRKNNFGYINLKRKFLHPMVYNIIQKMYTNLPLVISGEKYVRLDINGVIVNEEDKSKGYTGIDFFIDNWDKINWNGINSKARIKKEALLSKLDKKEVFVEKWLVIPA